MAIASWRTIRLMPALLLLVFAGCGEERKATLEDAQLAWVRGECQTAAALYEEYLKLNLTEPELAKTRFNLANVYYLCPDKQQRNFNKAQEHYRLVIDQANDELLAVASWQRIAEIFQEGNRRYEAIAEYENLLQRYPDTAQRRKIRLAIADLYNELNNYGQAETEYEKVVSISPYDELSEAAYLRLSSIHNLREQHELTITVLQQIAANSTGRAIRTQARFSMADVYLKQFRYDQAIAQLRQIEEPNPQEAEQIKKRLDQIARDRNRHVTSPAEIDWNKPSK